MAIGNINVKIVNRTTKICVVYYQCQYTFMVACLLNAVSLQGNTASYPHLGVRNSPQHGHTIFLLFVVIVGSVYCIFQLQVEFAQDNGF